MKDPYFVLRQKEIDLERVRKEVQALLIVAVLLADGEPPDSVQQLVSAFPSLTRPFHGGASDELARYYPFLKHALESKT